jgi:hypothetical protein
LRLQPDDGLGYLLRHGVHDRGIGVGELHLGLFERVRTFPLHRLDHLGGPLLEGGARGLRAGVDEEDETLQRDDIQVSTPLSTCGNAETVTSS